MFRSQGEELRPRVTHTQLTSDSGIRAERPCGMLPRDTARASSRDLLRTQAGGRRILRAARIAGTALGDIALADEPLPPLFQAPRIFASIRTSGTDCNNEIANGNSAPEGLVVADLVGNDSRPDVAIVNAGIWNVSVFHNTGTWKATPLGIPCGLEPIAGSLFSIDEYHISTRDIDAADMDGDLDLVRPVYSFATGGFRVAILKNNNGTYGEPEFSDLPADMNSVYAIVVDDFNADDRKDIVVAGSQPPPGFRRSRATVRWPRGAVVAAAIGRWKSIRKRLVSRLSTC